MIRELVLVSGDMSGSPWFASRTPPVPPLPEGITAGRATSKADANLFVSGPVNKEMAASRLSDGDTCSIVMKHGTGLIAQMWLTEKPRFIEWIGCNVAPPEGHVHLYNAWVEPEFRGLGLQWVLAAISCSDVMDRGKHHICAGVERKEYPPFARKYAAMSLGVISAYGSIWALKIFGRAVVTISAGPPRSLEKASEAARKIYARRVGRSTCV
jgi:hypothetical protein